MLGLTATASQVVVEDVKDILNIPGLHRFDKLNFFILNSFTGGFWCFLAALVFYAEFNRPNLFYEVRYKPAPDDHLEELVSLINGRFRGQSGIVYCFTRKECEELAKSFR